MQIQTALSSVLLVTSLGLSSFAHAAPQVVKDVLGRQVRVDLPAKRVVLAFYFEDYMAIGGEKAFDKVVGISREAWEGWRPANWALFTAHRPSLKTLPDVGEVEVQTFSVEKVLALKPDVVVLADWQYKGLGPDVKRLEDAGLPVVVVDYNMELPANHYASTLLLGKIAGDEKRAKQVVNEYRHAVDQVQSRIAKARLPKPRFYVEFGNKGPAEYSFTYGKGMWGPLGALAGGDNIAAPFVEWYGPMNPEKVLASQPDVVFVAGTESTRNPTSMLIGQGVDRKLAAQRLTAFTQRNGWSNLPAVKNKRVYGVYQGASRTVMDYTMVQFMAKAMYPDLFRDINPEANYLNFYRRYLPVAANGTFTVGM
ncbi:ABC-type Fe3+-hydroxamate transport system substrate-binding protein [Microvirgula sp. AG722]|uniref:ABC transporter substrate-binding protein n=1 Tax=Microvirgula sp. AG722 TaxID=2183901 RepID=UPI000DC55C65|nr:ABC transporter substrate-binding protein [Microvirgula sp. AG722]RAS13394.1 ABC-type Fe3+-hydroxamate transport system substrate-binding protein [Microvirgula sp. AG722]